MYKKLRIERQFYKNGKRCWDELNLKKWAPMMRSCDFVLAPISSRSIVDVFEASRHVGLQDFSRSAKILCFSWTFSITACKRNPTNTAWTIHPWSSHPTCLTWRQPSNKFEAIIVGIPCWKWAALEVVKSVPQWPYQRCGSLHNPKYPSQDQVSFGSWVGLDHSWLCGPSHYLLIDNQRTTNKPEDWVK